MMEDEKRNHPPRWAERFLSWYCKPELLEDLQGDLHEYFERNRKAKGIFRARLIYVLDVLKFFRFYTIRKPEFISLLIHYIMIGSYIKTSGRNMLRNRLFSAINIIGLAISMSVGLLVIAFVSDLVSFDNFHAKKDRMYRVITHNQQLNNPPMTLASTSVAAGRKILEGVSGIEDLTIMRRGFAGDAAVGNNITPISGLWADNSFFKLFSFQLLEGDISTALKEPYSIILTQKAAKKLFGDTNILGKSIRFDTVNYLVTGVMKDIPRNSHMRFESIVSFSTVELQKPSFDGEFDSWGNIYSNYVYLTLPEDADVENLQSSFNKICERENKYLRHRTINLSLQPSDDFVIGKNISNPIGPTIHYVALWILSGLAGVVILSACFNYTNLSIARSLRRSKEVGIRKVIGAQKSHVLSQFIAESMIIALIALVFSFVIYLFLRDQFLGLSFFIEDIVSLTLSLKLIGYFFLMALAVGLLAGFLPAWFYSRINVSQVLKDTSSIKVFRRVNLRKALIVVQYTFSLMFITATVIGYNQYRSFLTFDLGFDTENILNIRMQGNKDNLFIKDLREIAGVAEISRSRIVTSVGSMYGAFMRYSENPNDSSVIWMNYIDENYLPLHDHKIIAGSNFKPQAADSDEQGVIVNVEALRQFDIARQDPAKALGETVIIEGKKLQITGVIKDFHYGTVETQVVPVAFRYSDNEYNGFVNAKIISPDLPATYAQIEKAWKKFDKVHPFDAAFYSEAIERNYNQFSVMVRVIGFLSFLAICIASMGLFGMVVFSTERRLKEISIRKVLGASEGKLVFILSKGFFLLLFISAALALPLTYLLFEKVVLINFAYHQPITVFEMVIGLVIVLVIAVLMVGSQTLKVARSNPAEVLKSE